MPGAHLAEAIRKAAVLVEALPYMQGFRGRTFLIKVGGSAMEDPELVRNLMRDIVFLEAVGINPVIVHGGGKAITQAMQERGLEARWVAGLRVTDAAAIGVVEHTLSKVINPELVAMLGQFGGKACGMSGRDVFLGRRSPGRGPDGAEVDIGFVGEVVECQTHMVLSAVAAEIVPVVSPVAAETGTGAPLNVNADLAAAALAKAISATKLIYLSDVRGLLADPADPESLVTSIDQAGIDRMIGEGSISGGMIPKMRSALDALAAGVGKIHLIDGRIPHSLLLEIFTNLGIGTEITK
jgi:acetylglutamate kinase